MERGVRVLKHHLDAAAEVAGEPAAGPVGGAERGHAARPVALQPGDDAEHRRLAAAGRTDEAEGLALGDREADVAHGRDVAVAALEADAQVRDLDRVHGADSSSSRRSTGRRVP